jgi:hypothetical protein
VIIRPRVLIYKRTHTGDPTPDGVFGLATCMGRVRARRYDAVIGVGGLGSLPRSFGIDRRVNWVGIGPRLHDGRSGDGWPLITFDKFRLLEQQGPKLDRFAPLLARYLFDINRRVVMSDNLSEQMLREIDKILKLAAPVTGFAARNDSDRTLRFMNRCKPTRICLCVNFRGDVKKLG